MFLWDHKSKRNRTVRCSQYGSPVEEGLPTYHKVPHILCKPLFFRGGGQMTIHHSKRPRVSTGAQCFERSTDDNPQVPPALRTRPDRVVPNSFRLSRETLTGPVVGGSLVLHLP